MYRAESTGEGLIEWLHKISTQKQPWQIAAAVVLGCACGLLPKANLLFPVVVAVLFVLPVHFPVAGVIMLASSLVAPMLHPIHGLVGTWLFQFDSLAQVLVRLDQVPILTWLKLNNTVVAGSITTSFSLAIPVYAMVHRYLLVKHTQLLANQSLLIFENEMLKKRQAALSWPSGDSRSMDRWAELRPAAVEPQVEPKPLAFPRNSAHSASSSLSRPHLILESQAASIGKETPSVHSDENLIDSIHALESLLESATSDPKTGLDAESILRRANRAAELVDSIVHALEEDRIERLDKHHPVDTYQAHETTISITRLPEISANNNGFTEEPPTSRPFLPIRDSMILTSHSPTTAPPMPKPKLGTIGEHDSVSQAHETATRNVEIRHEEALRHLLSHLRSIQDEARQA